MFPWRVRPSLLAFLAGATSLALELVLVRLLAFFLTSAADFLAIPLALLGLATGSLLAHFVLSTPPERLVGRAAAAVLPSVAASAIALFLVFDQFFSRVTVWRPSAAEDALRLVVYSGLLAPPFVVFGVLFAALFAANADRLGRIYAADLAGAALGCVVTPVLLTAFGLPQALLGVLFLATLLSAAGARSAALRGLVVVGFGLLCAGVAAGGLFREHPEPRALARSVVSPSAQPEPAVREVDVRWNEIARTALVRVDTPGAEGAKPSSSWYVVQDNGLSNVTLQGWPPSRERANRGLHSLPFRLGRRVDDALVLFAGAGRDLMALDVLSDGRARLTGVEINGAVVDLATGARTKKLRIGEFLAKDNVDLVVQEGRDFLQHDAARHDLVYVANNGAVFAGRTGHTRKFLDTREAMEAYLDRLAPDGLLVFVHQPVAEKLPSLAAGFAARGGPPFDTAAYVFGDPGEPALWSLVVSPRGFTGEELAALDAFVAGQRRERVLYRPGAPRSELEALGAPRPVTDDRPFVRGLELGALTVWPDTSRIRDLGYVSSWVKVFTVVLFGGLSGLASAAVLLLGRGEARVPAPWVAYLFLTGVGYMCVEIGLIARTELFVGNPLYAVAVNLAVFLVASAIGSAASERRPPGLGPAALVAVTAVAIGWGLVGTAFASTYALSAPLAVKIGVVAVTVGPTAAALGTFYPYAVERLVRGGRAGAVPATYALTTLSSVFGSAFAMTAIVETGFRAVVVLGGCCYVAAGVVAARARTS